MVILIPFRTKPNRFFSLSFYFGWKGTEPRRFVAASNILHTSGDARARTDRETNKWVINRSEDIWSNSKIAIAILERMGKQFLENRFTSYCYAFENEFSIENRIFDGNESRDLFILSALALGMLKINKTHIHTHTRTVKTTKMPLATY